MYGFNLDLDCTLGSRLAENGVWITCQLDRKPTNCMVDTGTGVTAVSKAFWQKSGSKKKLRKLLDALSDARYFTTLDLQSGYWQVPVREDDKEKTAFVSQHGH